MSGDAVVIDANVLIDFAARALFDVVPWRLVVPALAHAECTSSLHAIGKRENTADYCAELHRRINQAVVTCADRDAADVWDISDQLDWTKTYDAEYLSVARRLGLALATYDVRVRRAAHVLGVALAEVPV